MTNIITYKKDGVKGRWNVYFNGKKIGCVDREWVNKPFHIINKNGKLSKCTYSNREKAAKALIKHRVSKK